MATLWLMSEKRGGRASAFLVFLMMLVLHCLAILLFTKGFLLTRTELSHYSQCSDVSRSPCFPIPVSSPLISFQEEEKNVSTHYPHPSFSPNSGDQGRECWTKPAIDRLVIIVLDALRFDFVAPSVFFEERKPWMDKLQVLNRLASQRGSSARMFKAIADPPTTSLQRLKGLMTGGLPTFIDIGNSFGAPAIVEDNLLYQLVQNGKRVVMMGDDTWLQLFPNHFIRSYPFPSFNVKDLHTVDDGCVEHLFPSLYEGDWDVLVAHFLGVDHAGHIFGVDSTAMIDKLEQYNGILERVVEVLESLSGPGDLHENTLLLVMGDHGQTLNGDHGGGNAEEVETSIFALSLKKPPSSVPLELDSSSCQLDSDGSKICIGSIQQLDFAATVSGLLGIPIPFGSIGRVNPELYALAAGSWNLGGSNAGDWQSVANLEWLQNYANVLCINSWQVKRYIDAYSASSVIGFSNQDLLHISDLYAQAYDNQSNAMTSLHALKRQIDASFNFLETVAELARSKWTEFNLQMMGTGFCIMLTSLVIHFLCIKKVDSLRGVSISPCDSYKISFRMIFAYIVVIIRACSFLSNSYILEEGRVASFLLATIGVLNLQRSIFRKRMILEAFVFVLLIPILRIGIEVGQSKQAVTSLFLKKYPSRILGIADDSPVWIYIAEIFPILAIILLARTLYKSIARRCQGSLKYIIIGSIFSYVLVAMHWASESDFLSLPMVLGGIGKNFIPRTVYAVGFAQLSSLFVVKLFNEEKTSDWDGRLRIKTLAILSAWSSTIILLSGKQGPLVASVSIIGGWCILRSKILEEATKNGSAGISALYSLPVTQWSLFAACLFFTSGHWCAFDGLRIAAAYIGFDEFKLIRQAILLAVDTFGFSHILPILGLPFLISCQYPCSQAEQRKQKLMQLFSVYLTYGFVMATTVTFTILCVIIQRRHLMVWGLFAPKFVFDVVGLLFTDIFICLASLYYF